jgi:hypothetical protein
MEEPERIGLAKIHFCLFVDEVIESHLNFRLQILNDKTVEKTILLDRFEWQILMAILGV